VLVLDEGELFDIPIQVELVKLEKAKTVTKRREAPPPKEKEGKKGGGKVHTY